MEVAWWWKLIRHRYNEKSNNNSSNSYVFGLRPQTITSTLWTLNFQYFTFLICQIFSGNYLQNLIIEICLKQKWLKCNFAATESDYPTNVVHGYGALLSFVLDALRRADGDRLVRQQRQRILDHKTDQTLRVEDKFIPEMVKWNIWWLETTKIKMKT